MSHVALFQLLRHAQFALARTVPDPFANWRLARKIAHFLSAPGDERSHDQAIALARARVAPLALLSIDRSRPITRIQSQGVEVLAWYLVPFSDLGDERLEDPVLLKALSVLPRRTQDVLHLSQAAGMDTSAISQALGVSRWSVGRHLRRAITVIAAMTHT
jgi:DNA-directed RNA polymerase specialized sigma24 family protein